ncbi:BMC domain-containing protein [Desulfosediminicola ganghwensis]|uniref:BMC domain-containing protein n=1 Tax=Desulfosediminicola ganghwensis TaxID=2569540 RepID=UPI0010AC8751|nr:BMC domain-containing protein [Desulfosediminicola ganghwensis]
MKENLLEPKQRIIQEYVPGKQVTLAHVIASPQKSIYLKLGLDDETAGAIGLLTITPYEGVIIAADVATKAAAVEIGFLDRFGGSLLLVGDVASVESAISEVLSYFGEILHYSTAEMTRS